MLPKLPEHRLGIGRGDRRMVILLDITSPMHSTELGLFDAEPA